ncbi:MAG: hypothetical protein JXO72_07870 [Vicinamibacteria bacterium]|nr:hypothetical protein [Vicinamibacteria bacterium]
MSHAIEQSREDANSLERKLRAIKRHDEGADTSSRLSSVTLTQAEINSYLSSPTAMGMLAGVSDVCLRLESGRIHLSARVDLTRIHDTFSSLTVSHPAVSLSGPMPVEISGTIDSADGFGAVSLDAIQLGPAIVSSEVAGRFVRLITRSARNPQGIDILSPFRLPFSIRKINLKTGRAVLFF